MRDSAGPITAAARLLLAAFALGAPVATASASPGLVTLTLPGPAGNGGMYYPDLQASFPGVDWSQLDRLYVPAAHYRFINLGNLPQRTPDRPLVITNVGGQVRVGGLDFHYTVVIGGGSNWSLSGRFDAAAATGDAAFPGHAGGDYANSRGRYGFLIDDAFEANSNSGLGIGGGATDFEIELVEIARVGFAGVLMKTDDVGTAHMENVRFHDNYIHDTESEGVYFGSTQGQPQHKVTGLSFYNNRLVRTGTEAVQLGQIGGGSEVHHNVIALGALAWKNPFQPFQDNSTQISRREGSLEVHHNAFIGGASTFLILFNPSVAGDSHSASDLLHVHDNYFSHGRNIGVYIHSQTNGPPPVRFEDNLFRAIDFQYDELDPGAPDHNAVFRIFNTSNPIELIGNRWQGPQSFAQVAGSNVVQSGNVNGPVPPIEFRDSGFPAGFDYLRLEVWTDATAAGAPVFYGQSDYVMHLGELYECVEPGQHTGKVPPDHPGTWVPRPLPPDDYRLAPGSPHQGIGLLDGAVAFIDGFESGDTAAWTSSTP